VHQTRHGGGRSALAVLAFVADDAKLATLDVALGPCVVSAGQARSICSPLAQDADEHPDQGAVLYTVLTGRSAAGALRSVAASGEAHLYVCEPAFVDAMAAYSEWTIGLAPDEFDAERRRLEAAWVAAAWPDRTVSMGNRLNRLHLARVARDKGHSFYLWYGPAVPRRALVRQDSPH
jgi:hypothetical protein